MRHVTGIITRPAALICLCLLACGAAPSVPETTASAPSAAPVYRTWPMGEKFRGEERGQSASGHTIHYFDDAERAAAELHVCNGKLCDAHGKFLDPEVATHPERGGTMLYAMGADGTVWGTFDGKLHVIHHSSLNAGRPVACAGEMTLVEGELLEIDNTSGHYRPPAEALDQIVAQLRKMGVDLSRTKVNYFGQPDRQPVPAEAAPASASPGP